MMDQLDDSVLMIKMNRVLYGRFAPTMREPPAESPFVEASAVERPLDWLIYVNVTDD